MVWIASFLGIIVILIASVLAVHPIDVREQEFVDSLTGNRLVLVGIDYQPGGEAAYGTGQGDPLSNPKACLRDAALMQQLGINTIRVYNVAPGLNHDECVSIFNTVGIYMLIDVNSPMPGQSLESSNPSGSYNLSYSQHIFSVVQAFKDYPNLIGFFAGNEVINQVSNGESCPPFIRAVQRDLHNYIAMHAPRRISVGYSAAQVQSILKDTWSYLQCEISSGSGANSRSDFFGLNSYSWCGTGSSFTISGYNVLVDWFSQSSIPVFFSEYGCNQPSPRYFDEVPTIFGPQMTAMSGGLVYQWTQDVSNYGLVRVNPDQSVQLLSDYYNFAQQLAKVNIKLIETPNPRATKIPPPECHSSQITGGDFSTNFNIPAPPPGVEALIKDGITNITPGKIVPVTQVTVQVDVFDKGGNKLTGLKIRPGATAQNTPNAVHDSATQKPPAPVTTHAPSTKTTHVLPHKTTHAPSPNTTHAPPSRTTHAPQSKPTHAPPSKTTHAPPPNTTLAPQSKTTRTHPRLPPTSKKLTLSPTKKASSKSEPNTQKSRSTKKSSTKLHRTKTRPTHNTGVPVYVTPPTVKATHVGKKPAGATVVAKDKNAAAGGVVSMRVAAAVAVAAATWSAFLSFLL